MLRELKAHIEYINGKKAHRIQASCVCRRIGKSIKFILHLFEQFEWHKSKPVELFGIAAPHPHMVAASLEGGRGQR